MASSRQIHRIATSVQAYMKFAATGELPALIRPRSPLIDLLEKISPRDRITIVGLAVNEALGYMGNRRFASAEAALRWVRPQAQMLESQSWPARSWQNKRFTKPLTLDTLLAQASGFPPGLAARYPHLRARAGAPVPRPRGPTPPEAPDSPDASGPNPAP